MENPPKQISQDGPFSNETASAMMPSQAKQAAAALSQGFGRSPDFREFALLIKDGSLGRYSALAIGLDAHRVHTHQRFWVA